MLSGWPGSSLSKQYHQLFRSMEMEGAGHPFAFSQRRRDTCRKWLRAGDCDVEGVVDQVVLEQLIHRLPEGMVEWVQCHRPALLEEVVQLAVCPSAEKRSLSLSPLPLCFLPSLSTTLSLCPLSRPCSCTPWHGNPPPKPAPRLHRFIPFPATSGSTHSPPQVDVPAPTSAWTAAPGPACWRCWDLEHFRDQCPVMELRTVVRILDAPQANPDRAGGYRILTDASDRALGAVLSQVVEGEEHPVLYISRKLSLMETKYSTVEKECLALQPFKFKVVHRPGAQMAVTDFLYRNGGGGEW
ncbi:uncharacterized protein LOC127447886 [Myxocyprinus asiaticus]|uniref:uncharacterized protein LOC127447886 n=1 Tax=Myxocyprinus asiaticus TaxID=70543 RepID=UPI00222248E3|nr:uncharacterized protein LOC127447886 [Myxocyprinus asiaticus]XP_051566016.1 uncharacterized protein LOC127447886 [Myxocyprinus asiaticus]XP_051566017.1 uncharacterized protein LOC127447886 [Myxocyprinus asiaticus]